jgi:HSP20 family protein
LKKKREKTQMKTWGEPKTPSKMRETKMNECVMPERDSEGQNIRVNKAESNRANETIDYRNPDQLIEGKDIQRPRVKEDSFGINESSSDAKENIKESISNVKKDIDKQKRRYEKKSKKEGVSPALKVLEDIITKFRQGAGQIEEVIVSTTETSKKPKEVLKPLADVLETNDTIFIIADMSGVSKDDIDIGISKNIVEIAVNYKENPEVGNAKFTQKERSYGITHRKVSLPTEIRIKEAKARFRDFTLTISLPKMVEDITKVQIGE